jgi:hypothetical protein
MSQMDQSDWYDQPDFQEKAHLFLESTSLERKIYLEELMTLHIDDLRLLHTEIIAQITSMRMNREIREAVQAVTGQRQEFSEADIKRYGFKKMIFFTFNEALRHELGFRKRKMQVEMAKLRKDVSDAVPLWVKAGLNTDEIRKLVGFIEGHSFDPGQALEKYKKQSEDSTRRQLEERIFVGLLKTDFGDSVIEQVREKAKTIAEQVQ